MPRTASMSKPRGPPWPSPTIVSPTPRFVGDWGSMMSKTRNRREPRPERRRYEIRFTRAAERGLASLPKPDQRRVDAAILELADDPHLPGSKKLRGAGDLYRIRVGDY